MINNERLLSTFLEYVQIDSESRHEGAMAARLIADLNELGCRVWQDNSQEKTGSETGNLYAVLPGNTDGDALLFSAHMDTVTPGVGVIPVVEDGIVRSQGNTVLGSDDKSGIVAVVEALRTIVENNFPHPTIEIVFTVCEELGLLGAKNMDLSQMTARKAFVLDSSGGAGSVTTAAPGQYKLDVTVVGRTSHAGVAPEKGISAIQVMAEAISNMKLLRIDDETTANIGSISANYATNIVPERARIYAEARSRNNEKLEAQVQHMMDCLQNACQKYGATLESTLTKAYAAYSYTEDDAFLQEVAATCRKIGIEPSFAGSGGGSDANVFNTMGIQAVVLGTGMDKVHTADEQIRVKDLEETAAFVLALATV